MGDEVAIAADVAREMLWVALKLGAPMVVVALGVGIGTALVQTFTQIHESSVALVPKLVAVLVTAVVVLPWAMIVLSDYTRGIMGGMGHWFP
jgi:flagellar biosynthetic protein FliQ